MSHPHARAQPQGRAERVASPGALQQMFRQHVDAVWRTALALGVDPDAAHDIVQDVFMTAHQRMDRFDAERSARAWLLGITRNVVRHHHRGTTRYASRLRRVPEPPPPEPPQRELERREAAGLVQEFIDQLDEKKRVVFVLGFVEGLSAREIAQTLGLKVATVYARARAAEDALARFVRRKDLPTRRER